MQISSIKPTCFAIITSLVLSACGGGDGNNNTSNDSATVTPPTNENTTPTTKTPMYTQGNPVYSFGTTGSQLNNQYTHTLLNNTISEKLTFIRSGRVSNTYSLQDYAIISKDGVYIQKNENLDRKSNIPTHYFISDNGETLITSFYNNEGVTPTVRHALSYKSYDVSGLKVNQYIYKNLLNNEGNSTSSSYLKASTATFPQGAIVFIPDVITALDEYYELFIDKHSVSYPSFDAVPDIANYPLTRVFGGITIRYSKSSSIYYAMYNGKVYQAFYYPKQKQIIYNKDNNYLYNKIAADAVANELALSCGTKEYHDSRSGCM